MEFSHRNRQEALVARRLPVQCENIQIMTKTYLYPLDMGSCKKSICQTSMRPLGSLYQRVLCQVGTQFYTPAGCHKPQDTLGPSPTYFLPAHTVVTLSQQKGPRAHIGTDFREYSSDDQRSVLLGPAGIFLHQATSPRLGNVANLSISNPQK